MKTTTLNLVVLKALLVLSFLFPTPIFAQVIITEWSQGTGGFSEWVEIAVLSDTDLRGWQFGDNDDDDFTVELTFNDIAAWENVEANTIIVIYNGGDVATSIPGEDTDFGDNVVLIPHNNTTFFTDETGGSVWPNFGLFTNSDTDDQPALVDSDGVLKYATFDAGSPGADGSQLASQDGDGNWQSGEEPADATPGSSPLVLPVELGFFNAFEANGEVKLIWETITELNNDFFIVERSNNGFEFEGIAKVNGNGTTFVPKNYQWLDNNPFPGHNYYRLKQVDFDGTSTIHETRVVRMSSLEGSIKLYPTIVHNELWVERNDEVLEEEKFVIFDWIGRVVVNGRLGEGVSRRNINVDELSKGKYFFVFEGRGGESLSFVKLK